MSRLAVTVTFTAVAPAESGEMAIRRQVADWAFHAATDLDGRGVPVFDWKVEVKPPALMDAQPVPVKVDSRIAFGIEYYTSLTAAEARGRQVRQEGQTYNGGYFHGQPCGRDASWDYTDDTHGRLYAVTVR